jgi:uncharacterized membrane protein
MSYLRPFLLAVLAFTLLDLLWLGYLGRGLYERYLGHHMREQVDWLAAVVFYFVFLAGLLYFVVLEAENSWQAAGRGALYGLVTYGTYELTNRAVVKDWPWQIVGIDILWGILLSAVVSWISYRYGMADKQ